ncbi:MAG TPA: WD40 repeat domain-containing protein, partial [Gemmataceae bacterium]|nr:WD40 repeat domain-containing protein [Gemmataceae bacterium]
MGSRRLIVCLLILAAPGSILVAGKGKNTGENRVDLYGDPLPLWAKARLGNARFRHKDFIRQIAYSDDGNLLATGSWRQVQVASRSMAFKEVTALAFSKDKRVLAVASRDFAADGISLVQFLNLSTGNLENHDFREQECHILSLAYSPDGRTLAAAVQRGGERALVRLWNVANGKGRTLCRFQHSSGIWNVAFSPDGTTVACPGEDNTVCVVELAAGKIMYRFKGHENEVTAVIFAPDGKTLISGSKDRTIRFWDLETKKEKQCLEGHDGYVIHLNVSADGKVLASQDSNYGARIWDTATGKEVVACRRAGEGSMALSPDGKLLALGSAAKTVHFWEVPTGREHAPRAGHRNTIVALAFSDDGATLASAGSDQTVRTWDPGTMKQLQMFQENAELVTFSSDRTLILGDGKNR